MHATARLCLLGALCGVMAPAAALAPVTDPITRFWLARTITAQVEADPVRQIILRWGIATGGHQGAAMGRQEFRLTIDKQPANGALQAGLIVTTRSPKGAVQDYAAKGHCTADPAQ